MYVHYIELLLWNVLVLCYIDVSLQGSVPEQQGGGGGESDTTAMMTPMVGINTIFFDRQMLKYYTCALNRIVRQYCTLFLGVPYT